MSVEPVAILHMGIFLAIVSGLCGLLVALFWSPFLLTERFRHLFGSLPPFDWPINYFLWIPLPAVCWGFLCGSVVSMSLDVRPPTDASPLYVSGLDGIIVATAVSLLLWPALLLYVLPARGFNWYSNEDTSTTVALVIGGTIWYFPWLVIPTYVIVLFAGFGDVMTGT
ncbi:hypothetical protein [Halostella sp. PRR32]|uniref:hypothetical protein n=1 Tax=Halostella sp. PRR32 TaxID=3098147 RepID=UPI002B1E31F2|nr:hypothetical protein [Halostella sp. PRR32]